MVDFLRALSIVLLLGMFYLAFKNKKFKRFLLIESVLIIVFIIGRQMYTSNLNTMDTVMWSLASDVTNKMITQSDKNIENNMHDVLSTIYDGNGFDIEQNIDGGTRHIKEYLDKYNGDVEMALMAYNGGPTRMAKRGVKSINDIYKMPKETQNYVPKVMKYYKG